MENVNYIMFATILSSKGQCPGVNEAYTDCGSGCGDFYCSDDLNRICPDVCTQGCYCAGGYARNDQGTCVPVDKCQASKNQTFIVVAQFHFHTISIQKTVLDNSKCSPTVDLDAVTDTAQIIPVECALQSALKGASAWQDMLETMLVNAFLLLSVLVSTLNFVIIIGSILSSSNVFSKMWHKSNLRRMWLIMWRFYLRQLWSAESVQQNVRFRLLLR